MRCTSDTEDGMTSFEGSRRKEISWRFHLGYFLKEERKSRERELTRVEQHNEVMIWREREELLLTQSG